MTEQLELFPGLPAIAGPALAEGLARRVFMLAV